MEKSGISLSMVVALAKKMAVQYGSIGISNIEAVSPNGIKFTLVGGTTYTVTLTFNAEGVSFDNSGTTMTATTVQDAVEEIYTSLQNTVSSLNGVTGVASLVAGTNVTITPNTVNKTITISANSSQKDIDEFSLTEGQEEVTYDTTDGVTVTANGKITFTDASEDTFETSYNIPLVADNGISIDANEQGTSLTIKSVAEYITINAPSSATNGTLTEEQLSELQSSENVHIMFNNELYRMQSKGHIEGYVTYSMVEYENNAYTIKSITVTINTRGWVLKDRTFNAIIASTDPTTSTEGYIGQMYINSTDEGTFICVSNTDGTYIWKEIMFE